MGAWGTGSFENDDASDFLNDLQAQEVTELAGLLLRIEKQPGYIEAPECSAAIAAAEVIAASKGTDPSKVLPQIDAWIREKRNTVTPDLTGAALGALRRIKTDSELKDLWDEAGRLQEWHHGIQDLMQRLARQ
jgi:hypothetical protein